MWIERVLARAFGPLQDESLELGEGMNVISGPNEAGKTSWHAATRLALTGVRRGPGRTKVVAEVIERHRPWDSPDRWEVEARLHLADGRAIDIIQDLAGRVACRARDVVLGDDVSAEIINDGTPDATRWLGLDRESFAAVAAVSQAQIMSVADSATALQDHMQRAAATRGTDATAAEAIERLKAFRREAIGAVRVGATGPLWTAMREQEAAESALLDAQRLHADFLERDAQLEEASRAHEAAERRLAVAEARRAIEDASQMVARAERASYLAARHPAPPAELAARDERADDVAAALDSWRRRPEPLALSGPSALELRQQLASLPDAPPGDRRPDRSVTDAARALDLAMQAVRLDGQWPATAAAPSDATRPRRPALPFVAGAVLGGLLGAGLVALGQPLLGGSLVIAALLALGAVWRWVLPGARSMRGPGLEKSAEIATREARAAEVRDGAARATAALRDALLRRGAAVGDDLRGALAAYEAACAEREDLARAAAGADGLRRAIEARESAEGTADRIERSVAAAETGLREVARRIGQPADGTVEEVVAALIAWQGERISAARASEVAIREWQELAGLLAGGTLDDLRAETERRVSRAERLGGSVGEEEQIAAGPSDEAAVAAARADVVRSRQAVDALTGELRQLASTLPGVPEMEERGARAAAEVARLQDLAAVIDETLALLGAAERRVHRDLAPILTAAVQRHLPEITGGAYVEVGMNPRDLSVEVKEARTGQWRDARLLSEGTREQIYLLLRAAMAEHLVTTGEQAPLLLDEVTAQADPQRKRRVLEVLHELSADRQVILFTHDDEVVAWAADSLSEPRDHLIRLATPAGAPLPEASIR